MLQNQSLLACDWNVRVVAAKTSSGDSKERNLYFATKLFKTREKNTQKTTPP